MELSSNRMLSFGSALKKYNSIKPIRGRGDQNTRPLARRTNDNLTIRQDSTTGDIVVRLYSTDIIRYSADGDGDNNQIMLGPYTSVLTNRVMWSILGPHVNTYWADRSHSAPSYITEVGGRYYNTPEFALIQPHWQGYFLMAGSKPFEVPRVDRGRARQVLHDTGFSTFRTWLTTLVRLGQDPRSVAYSSRTVDWRHDSAVRLLTAGEAGWAEAAGLMSQRCALDRELAAMRLAVYQSEGVYRTDTVPFFTDYNAMRNAINQMRRAD